MVSQHFNIMKEERRNGRLTFSKSVLFGRDTEIKSLRESYERVQESRQTRVVLLKGYSGSGKSVLANTLREVVSTEGYFVSGKFDKSGSRTPYSAIVEAFSSLCKSLSTSKEAESIRQDIQTSFGSNDLDILASVVPNVSLLIRGNLARAFQADKKTKWGFERLTKAFRGFIKVLEHNSVTLALFMDDLQWADVSSLKLLNDIITNEGTSGLLFIGTYRSNEVDRTHPLNILLRGIAKHEIPLEDITVSNLNVDSINSLVAEATRSSPSHAMSLAEIVHSKTDGNAFFAIQFLRMLQEEKMLYMSAKSLKLEWDVDQIMGETAIADNVVDLVAKKIRRLPESTRKALQIGACMGSRFHMEVLSAMINPEGEGDDPSEVVSVALDVAVNEGLVMRRHASSTYKFSHDRIQQSAYSLIKDVDEKEKLHLTIGRHLQRMYNSPESRQEWMQLVFIDQLNHGSRLIVDDEERMELARLNLLAAEKVVTQSAFFPASEYLKAGLGLMEGLGGWERNYRVQLGLCTLFAEVNFYIGNFDECYRYVDVVLENSTSLKGKYRVFLVKMEALASQQRLDEAIDTGFDILSQLGERFPRKAKHLHVVRSFAATTLMTRGKTDDDLLSLPTLEDEDMLQALKILSTVIVFAWAVRPVEDTVLLCLRMFRISVKHGLTKYSAYAFAVFSCMQGSVLRFDEAYRFGQLSQKLMHRFQARKCDCKTMIVLNSFVFHLRRPLQERLDQLLTAYDYGMETGDIHQSSIAAFMYVMMYYYSGLPLGPLLDDSSAFGVQLDRYNQESMFMPVQIYKQTVMNLLGRSANPVILTGTAMDQDESLRIANACNEMNKVQPLWFQLNQLGFYFGDMDVAAKYGERLWNRKRASGPMFHVPAYLMFLSLTAMEMARRTGKRTYRYNARKHTKQLSAWIKKKALNAQHKLLIVLADRARDRKSSEVVKTMFDDAIRSARRSGFTQDAALANELAGKHFLSVRDDFLASCYLSTAQELYDDWGATAKVDQMDATYRFLLGGGSGTVKGTHLRGVTRFPMESTARHHSFNPFRPSKSLTWSISL